MFDLSIIIVSYNTKEITIKCVESVLKNGSKTDFEIIIVDNNSKDGSVRKLRGLWGSNPSIKFIENEKNLGFAKAVNQGIKKAKGEYILLLNSDTVVKRGAFERLLGFAKTTPDAGVVGARLLNADGSVQESCFNFPTIKRAIEQYWLKKNNSLDKFYPKGSKFVEVESVVGAAFLITPAALKAVGGLDERYFFFYEDKAYCREVRKAGFKVYYLPSAEIIHYHGSSGVEIADYANQWRRLIPSSKVYHGAIKYYLFNFIIWSSQKWQKLLRNRN